MSFSGIVIRMGSALACALIGSMQPATADTLRYNGAWFGSYSSSFSIHDSVPSPLTQGVYSGAFRMTDVTGPTLPAGTSFMAWCVDIFHRLNTGSAGDSYALRTGSDFFGAGSARVASLERLASYVVDADGNAGTTTLQSALSGSLQSAAFQLAVWEIVNEDAASAYNVASGDFYATGGSTAVSAINLANTWLTQSLTWSRTQVLSVWAGGNSTQDLGVFAPIPEAETYAMMLAGLGLMAFVARRRQKNLGA